MLNWHELKYIQSDTQAKTKSYKGEYKYLDPKGETASAPDW